MDTPRSWHYATVIAVEPHLRYGYSLGQHVFARRTQVDNVQVFTGKSCIRAINLEAARQSIRIHGQVPAELEAKLSDRYNYECSR